MGDSMEAVINYWAILVSAILAQCIGALWYSKWLFAERWQKLVKLDWKKMKPTPKPFVVAFVGTLLMAYILAQFIFYAEATTWIMGLETAAWLWIGFVLTPEVISSQFNQRPLELVLIDAGHYLAIMLVAGAILAVWV